MLAINLLYLWRRETEFSIYGGAKGNLHYLNKGQMQLNEPITGSPLPRF